MAATYRLVIRFPAGFERTVTEVSEGLRSRFKAQVPMSALHVRFPTGARATIEGFGMPFSNPGHPSEDWINGDDIMIHDMTLVEFLQQRSFYLVVGKAKADWLAKLIPRCPITTFNYPYGDEHCYSMERYLDMQNVMKGERFEPRWTFDSDNEHIAVTTQSTVQDILWVAQGAADIFTVKMSAYLVPQNPDAEKPTAYYAIMTLPDTFHAKYDEVWKRLTGSSESIELAFHQHLGETEPPIIDLQGEWKKDNEALWLAKIMEYPSNISVLQEHSLGELDLVLLVRVGTKKPEELYTFPDRSSADAALAQSPRNWHAVSLVLDPELTDIARKVDAVCEVREGARPSNPEVWGMPTEEANPSAHIPEHVVFNMKLQRDLLRGTGFYKTLCGHMVNLDDVSAEDLLSKTLAATHLDDSDLLSKRLPIVDFLELPETYLLSLMEEVLPADRERFIRYMSKRPLGLGIVTAVSSTNPPSIPQHVADI